ncbi:MAG: CinA family protein [Rhodothalassiaceae bacterium]
MFPERMREAAEETIANYRSRGLRIATAESCTGGLLAALLTEIPGASDVFERGFVTYSNAAKTSMLSVPQELIAIHGAVSEPVARAMAEGALRHSEANIAIAITGVAGPGGGTPDKPVGYVCFGLALTGGPTLSDCRQFPKSARSTIRLMATTHALALLAS